MTSHIKQYVEMSDMAAINIECTRCSTSLTLKMPTDGTRIPNVCPGCNETWSDEFSAAKPMQRMAEFLSCYKRLTSILDDADLIQFKLKFEVTPDTTSASRVPVS
jgi:hypothetical protein